MKNLILTSLFLVLGFTTYSQNKPALLHEQTTTVTLAVIQNQAMVSPFFLKSSPLKGDLQGLKTKKTPFKNLGLSGFKSQSKDFFTKFYGRKVIRLS